MPPALARPRLLASLAAGAFLLLALPAPTAAQLPGSGEATPDSVARRLGLPEGHSPRGALRRAAMVPGWGQYYNRQYWKVPVVVAGLGGAVFSVIYHWDRYLLYRNAWRFRRVNGQMQNAAEYEGPYGGPAYENAYNELLGRLGQPSLPASVKAQRSEFRRWRDISILGTGLVYILQVADAYVGAHLLGFELDEDLSLRVAPRPRGGLAATLRLSL